jgi:hypothetical protein
MEQSNLARKLAVKIAIWHFFLSYLTDFANGKIVSILGY